MFASFRLWGVGFSDSSSPFVQGANAEKNKQKKTFLLLKGLVRFNF